MRVLQADIVVIKYVELVQVHIILNMRFRFWKMWACFEDAEKCVVAKVVRFPTATIIESSRPRKCFWYDVLHWDLVSNCIKIVIVSTNNVVAGVAFPKGRPWIT